MLVVGLTGGVASGKSTVARLFAEHQVPILDADLIARELVTPGQPALDELVELFGPDILDEHGALNRRALRRRVFTDAQARARLEAILHPRIRRVMLERLQTLDAPYALLVIPLLVDIAAWEMVDRILVVDTDEATQLERLMARDGIDAALARAMLDSQVGRADRLAAADDVIDNRGDLAALRRQVDALHRRYLALARREAPPGDTVYEHPLNERMRTFLRIEQLLTRVRHHARGEHPDDAHAAIVALWELSQLLGRGDPKGEIIKELERQQQALRRHAERPEVDQARLAALLGEQTRLIRSLHDGREALDARLQNDGLFTTVRQRLSMPGGSCDFDLPLYAWWRRQPPNERIRRIGQWLEPLRCAEAAVRLCLDTLRRSGDLERRVAHGGYHQEALDNDRDVQLLRVAVAAEHAAFPNISAGRQRLNLRFFVWSEDECRAVPAGGDLPFQLALCAL
ncbi:MAG: hypothetical protein KatS3mg121_1505 [Gammaproteobacteria bacterium]|nr:MAG: hypothetical protein KatS3mg121_1505 [Gammaproteobacteria bacterium]